VSIAPWPAIALVVTALLGMLAALRALRVRHSLHPELTRKLAHVGIGLASLSYPWLFREAWPVVLLGALGVLTLLALRHVPMLRGSVGAVVNGVNRSSAGDLYFPIAATGLFLLARGDRVLYSIPILTLALADAVAALVGVFYGHFKYEGAEGEGQKSLEGSAAFLLVAFLATHVPLLLGTDVGRAESLLIGLTVGVLVMILEAVAWRGLDNLFIPFGGFLLLRAFLALDATALVARLAATLAMLGLVLALRRRRTLTDAAVLAGVLIGYVAWSVGGWRWLVPPLVLFLLYTLLWPRSSQIRERPHDVTAVLSVTGCGVLWLLLATVLARPGLYFPYTLAFAANLVFIGINWLRDYRRAPAWRAVLPSAVVAWAAFTLPYLAVTGAAPPAALHAAIALGALLLAGVAYVLVIPRRHHAEPSRDFPWTRQALLGLGASVAGWWVAG
jgi:phytol kinase